MSLLAGGGSQSLDHPGLVQIASLAVAVSDVLPVRSGVPG
jgi:hypothetical protein